MFLRFASDAEWHAARPSNCRHCAPSSSSSSSSSYLSCSWASFSSREIHHRSCQLNSSRAIAARSHSQFHLNPRRRVYLRCAIYHRRRAASWRPAFVELLSQAVAESRPPQDGDESQHDEMQVRVRVCTCICKCVYMYARESKCVCR